MTSKLYAVGGNDGVQLWTDSGDMMLHVPSPVSGVSATCVNLTRDGRHVISGSGTETKLGIFCCCAWVTERFV